MFLLAHPQEDLRSLEMQIILLNATDMAILESLVVYVMLDAIYPQQIPLLLIMAWLGLVDLEHYH